MRTGRPPATPAVKAKSRRVAGVLKEYFEYRSRLLGPESSESTSLTGPWRYGAKKMSLEMAELGQGWTPGWSTLYNAVACEKNSFTPRVVESLERFFMRRAETDFLFKLKQAQQCTETPAAGEEVGYLTHLRVEVRQQKRQAQAERNGQKN